MTNYDKGRRFEYRVRDDLKDCGHAVLRAPGSKGVADLWAVKDGRILFVQCKTDGRLPPAEWNALFDTCVEYGAVPVLAYRDKKQKLKYKHLIRRKQR